METDPIRINQRLLNLALIGIIGLEEPPDGTIVLHVETQGAMSFCNRCGVQGTVKERPVLKVGDLPICGRPVVLAWRKYRWECPARCRGSWTEQRPDIIEPRCTAMTVRAGHWATRQVGRHVRPVSDVAGELGVSWHTVMDTVTFFGAVLIDDPARIGATKSVGVDETCFMSATATSPTTWVGAVADVDRRFVIDVFQGRQAPDLTGWLAKRDKQWRDGVTTAVTDLHEPFRAAITNTETGFVNAALVADPFHVVGVANRVVDKVRRRVQTDTLGHRGRASDPLYKSRKLLLLAAEKLVPGSKSEQRLEAFLKIGDPNGEVREARDIKELVRDIYTMWNKPGDARRWITALIQDCKDSKTAEIRGLGRTLKQWIEPILGWHTTGASNGPSEGLNNIIKKVKRVAAGFKNFDNYRTRILLACGACNWNLLTQ